jgi:hypothetical protein
MLPQRMYFALALYASSFLHASALPAESSAPINPSLTPEDLHAIDSEVAPGATLSYKEVRYAAIQAQTTAEVSIKITC